MPNVTIYLSDEEWLPYAQMDEGNKKIAREKAKKVLLQEIKK